MNQIELKAVGKAYSGQVVLENAELDVRRGESVAVLGRSGSGKSTLLKLIGGLDTPDRGAILHDGRDLSAMADDERTHFRRQNLGFVFQFYNLIPSLTARENVNLVTEIARRPMPADTALELVGLAGRMDHFPAQMSGGEQQRVAIARAIAKQPDVLLCDEPTGALDSKTGVRVLEALSQVNSELGTTTALITHNAAIKDMAHRVLMFGDGRISGTQVNTKRKQPSEISW